MLKKNFNDSLSSTFFFRVHMQETWMERRVIERRAGSEKRAAPAVSHPLDFGTPTCVLVEASS